MSPGFSTVTVCNKCSLPQVSILHARSEQLCMQIEPRLAITANARATPQRKSFVGSRPYVDAGVDAEKEAAKSTAAAGEATKDSAQGVSVEVREGEVSEQKARKRERKRDRVVTPYTKLVNRVRGLISRIRCLHISAHASHASIPAVMHQKIELHLPLSDEPHKCLVATGDTGPVVDQTLKSLLRPQSLLG